MEEMGKTVTWDQEPLNVEGDKVIMGVIDENGKHFQLAYDLDSFEDMMALARVAKMMAKK
jgi:hypothetical protein